MKISPVITCALLCSALTATGCTKPAGHQADAENENAPGAVARKKSKLPVYNSKKLLPAWLHEDPIPENDLHHVLDFKLTDQRGNQRALADLDGKIYVSYFFFASCSGICLKMAEQLKKVQGHFSDRDEVRLVGHSVTPGIDTPEALTAYGEQKGINAARWYLLTGAKKDIFDLARKSYFAVTDSRDDDYKTLIHTENLILVDKENLIRGVYNGTFPQDVNRLVEDITVLLEEQADTPAGS